MVHTGITSHGAVVYMHVYVCIFELDWSKDFGKQEIVIVNNVRVEV